MAARVARRGWPPSRYLGVLLGGAGLFFLVMQWIWVSRWSYLALAGLAAAALLGERMAALHTHEPRPFSPTHLMQHLAPSLIEALLFLPLLLLPDLRPLLLCGVLLLAFLVDWLAYWAKAFEVDLHAIGPLPRPQRMLALAGFALLLGIGFNPGPWMALWLGLTLLLTLFTLGNRVRHLARSGASR